MSFAAQKTYFFGISGEFCLQRYVFVTNAECYIDSRSHLTIDLVLVVVYGFFGVNVLVQKS